MKVLLVKTSSMGDVIHTLAAARDAARALPGLELHWCVEEAFADIPRMHADVRKVHTVALRRWRKSLSERSTWREIAAARAGLKSERFDVVVDVQGLLKSLFVARWANAPIHGFDLASVRERAAALGYGVRHAVPHGPHVIERNRRLVAAALGYQCDLTRIDHGVTPPPPPALIAGHDKLVPLLHGTTWASKRWPVEFWVDVARRVAAMGLQPAVPYANDEERKLAEAVAAGVPSTLVIPRMSIRDIAGILAASRLVIGTESGLMHLAAAFGRPTLALFAGSSAAYAEPKGRAAISISATTPCAPCNRRDCPLYPGEAELPCHKTITPDDVMAALERLPWR